MRLDNTTLIAWANVCSAKADAATDIEAAQAWYNAFWMTFRRVAKTTSREHAMDNIRCPELV